MLRKILSFNLINLLSTYIIIDITNIMLIFSLSYIRKEYF